MEEIESPCIGICRIDNEVCCGCKRTTDEIVEWYNFTNEQKQAVLDRIFND